MDYLKLTATMLKDEPRRSRPFQEGMAAVLRNRIDQTLVKNPYEPGSPESDAFDHGRLRAHNEFRNLLIEAGGDRSQAIAILQRLAGDERRVA
ncbi:hypothetical protein CW360_14060 [Pseudomonas fluvialis]|uniref:Uncharacterized protein n=1 Tax=Pseudomonas fluvialis TaxID=1793966 RepID=A0A2I0CMP0_9PSED|nr:hypothetical protein [Pseudomonas pharmacofabricae]PKF70419.1 hypothetical protein CW360_14060 [Pseudomonas pharmacofabricae]